MFFSKFRFHLEKVKIKDLEGHSPWIVVGIMDSLRYGTRLPNLASL